MAGDQEIETGIVSESSAGDAALVGELTDLINTVYATAEEGLWLPGTPRTSATEVADLIRLGQLAVARLAGRLVGAVRIQRLPGGEGEFGMLVSDPAHRGIGIGSRLVGFAEQGFAADGVSTVQLEVLMPRTWRHPSKEFLDAWYTRIGYRRVRSGALEESYPDLAPLLATPCDFVIYHKGL